MIGGDDLLALVEKDSPKLGIYLRRYVKTAIETTAQNAGVSPTGKIAAPPAPSSLTITPIGTEHVQITIQHNGAQKGVQYITHFSPNSPQFSTPLIHDHGSSRCPPPVYLPSKDGSGNVISYYARCAAQNQGSDPSPWT